MDDRPPRRRARSAPSRGTDRPGASDPAAPDRWEWRRRIRADPRRRRVYRVGVAVLGGVVVLLGLASGPLPGPGGIPLVLLGLAVLASEFLWARHVLDRVRALAHRSAAWVRARPRWVRWGGSAATAAVTAGAVWVALAVGGAPDFLPPPARAALDRVPGVGS